ncbi:MAG: PorT family protein [Endomicrobium sp.]|jgi:hypothetical protein|nr:PorT family protein [Endomicrobium sp.]
MKKKLFLLAVFYSVGVCVFAQQQGENLYNKPKPIKGIKLSMNTGFLLSNMIGKSTVDHATFYADYDNLKGFYSARTSAYSGRSFFYGYKFGIGILMEFNKLLALGIDINYEGKGCRIPASVQYVIYDESGNRFTKKVKLTESAKFRLHYLILPMKMEIRYKMFYAISGIYTGFLLDAKGSANFLFNNSYVKLNYNRKSRYSLIDFGTLLSLGICIPLSLNDFLKISIGGEWSIIDMKNRRFIVNGKTFPSYNQSYNIELKYERKIK